MIVGTRWVVGRVSLIVVALAVMSAWAASARGAVFWAQPSANEIGMAAGDGSGANSAFITGAGGPQGVAISANDVFWTNNTTGTIGEAPLTGTSPDESFISGAAPHNTGLNGIAVGGGYIFWSDADNGVIGRANLDGSNVQPNFITGANYPQGIATDGQYIYWANDGSDTIGRATITGGGVNQSFIGSTAAGQVVGVAVNPQYLFWTNDTNGAPSIGRANLDGSGAIEDLITGASVTSTLPFGIAADGTYVYWGSASATGITRADLDGTNVTEGFIPTTSDAWSVAVGAAAPPTPPVVNSAGDAPAENAGANGCNTGSTVTNSTGQTVPECTLRAAIQAENAGTVTQKSITFSLPASANGTIMPTSALPAVTASGVTIDGGPGLGGVVLDGINVPGSATVGVELSGGGDGADGLAFQVWSIAIKLDSTAGGDAVTGNRIGISATGTDAEGVNGIGIDVEGSPNNTIGGPAAAAGNLISDASVAVLIRGAAASGNVVEGNLIGTDSTGTQAAGDGSGIDVVDASGTTIGGHSSAPGTAPGNVIDGNGTAGSFGVLIGGQTAIATGNSVQGNAIGLLANGTEPAGMVAGFAFGVGSAGMTSGTIVGGGSSGDGNVITGAKTAEVSVSGTLSSGTQVLGNLIGTDPTGSSVPGGQAVGVQVSGATHTTVGAPGVGANVIAGNSGGGISVVTAGTPVTDYTVTPPLVYPGTNQTSTAAMSTLISGNIIGPLTAGASLSSGAPQPVGINLAGIGDTAGPNNEVSGNEVGIAVGGSAEAVVGNLIGTNPSGVLALPNGTGVSITGKNAQLGVPGAKANTISGNLNNVVIGADATVENNLIGTTSLGNAPISPFTGTLPEDLTGTYTKPVAVIATTAAAGSQIGGTLPGFGNVISGNPSDGLVLDGALLVQGNKIGVGANGTTAVPNSGHGILIDRQGTLGAIFPGGTGTTAGAGGNTIANNAQAGIDVLAGTSPVSMLSDSIYDNAGGGIVLGSGANGAITPPELVAANQHAGQTTLQVLAHAADARGSLQIFVANSCTANSAQGRTLLRTLSVPYAGILLPTLPLQPVGTKLTATITHGSGASAPTSQFSTCVSVGPALTTVTSASTSATTSSATATLPVTVTCASGSPGTCAVAAVGTISGATASTARATTTRRRTTSTLTIGRDSFRLAAGATAIVKLKLTHHGLARLRARHTLAVTLTVKITKTGHRTIRHRLKIHLSDQRQSKPKHTS